MSRVYFNGVLFVNHLPVAHAGPGGQANASEECWVTVAGQKVKQEFTNLALAKDLSGTTKSAFIEGYPLAHIGSYTLTSYGDEGSEGGVKSGTKQGRMFFLSGSSNVTYEGKPVCRHGDRVILNDENSLETTWIQPASSERAIQAIRMGGVEPLAHPEVLNIQLIRSPEYQFLPAQIQQYLMVEHEVTHRESYRTYGVFKQIDYKYLWHEPVFRKGRYQVYEIYEKSAAELIKIPLGVITSATEEVTTPGMKLVPLAFKRYDDVQKSAEGAQALYPNTYIYVFKDGYLWRELEINSLGRLSEVDLESYYLEEVRLARGELLQGLILPIEDAQGTHEFHIATSCIRWSWPYIHKLGGVNPEDPRFKTKYRGLTRRDENLIKSRLQRIDIHGLVHQGENCTTLPNTETEAYRLEANKHCHPPDSNRYWLIEEDILKLSKGTKKFSRDLYWRPAPVSEYTPTLNELGGLHQNSGKILGSAVYLIDDPIGRLRYTAELMNLRHGEWLAYSEKEGEAYLLAKMIEQIKTVMEEDDYLEVTKEQERLAHIKDFDERQAAFQAFMKESVPSLIHWFESSHEKGQWLDFKALPDNHEYLNSVIRTFSSLAEEVYSAFHLSELSVQYLKEDVKKSTSYLLATTEFALNFKGMQDSLALTTTLSGTLADALAPDSESLKKVLDFSNKMLNLNVSARLDYLPEDLSALEELTAKKTQHSGIFRVKEGLARSEPIELPKLTPRKKLTLIFEEVPIDQLNARLSRVNPSSVEQTLSAVNEKANLIDKNVPMKAVLTVLTVFATHALLVEREKLKEEGRLNEGHTNTINIDITRNLLYTVEFALDLGVLTREARGELVSKFVKNGVKLLGFIGCFVGMYSDGTNAYNYMNSGEYDLMTAHTVGVLSGVPLIMRALPMITTTMMLYSLLSLLSIFLALVAFFLLFMYTKDPLKRWIFDGYWGESKKVEKDSISYSIEKFHQLVTVVQLQSIRGVGNAKNQYNSPYAGYFRSLVPHKVHQEIVFELYIPMKGEYQIRTEFIVYGTNGMFVLPASQVKLEKFEPKEQGTNILLKLNGEKFEMRSVIGKLQLVSIEAETGNFVGKDAYELQYDPVNTLYSSIKVMYT